MQQSQWPWTQLQRLVMGHSQFCNMLLVKSVSSFIPAFSFLSTAEITVRGKVSSGTPEFNRRSDCCDPFTSNPVDVSPTDRSCHWYGHEPDGLEKAHWGEIMWTSNVLMVNSWQMLSDLSCLNVLLNCSNCEMFRYDRKLSKTFWTLCGWTFPDGVAEARPVCNCEEFSKWTGLFSGLAFQVLTVLWYLYQNQN